MITPIRRDPAVVKHVPADRGADGAGQVRATLCNSSGYRTIAPSILYFGTPAMLISTDNENGSFNLAPMSSTWALGQVIVMGLGAAGQTGRNLRSRRDLVISLPAPDQWPAVARLAPLTGRNPVPASKRGVFRFQPDEFGAAGHRARALRRRPAAQGRRMPLQMDG